MRGLRGYRRGKRAVVRVGPGARTGPPMREALRGRAAWVFVGGACIALAAACRKDAVITTRAVTLHAPQNCAPDLSNLDSSAVAAYQALGDYEPAPPSDVHAITTVGIALPEIDPAAQALLVAATEEDRPWQGVSALAPAGPVDVLLLPATTPCALHGTLGPTAGAAIGVVGSQRVLVVGGAASTAVDAGAASAGGAGPDAGPPGSTVMRLDTGDVSLVSGSGRTGATVTAFGTEALVAGGKTDTGEVLGVAMAYNPDLGAFDPQPIALDSVRERAGAAVLATGETLLVGGDDGSHLLASMEIVDPVTRKSRTGAAALAVPRVAPTVLRLASGEIFVAGGVDAGGTAVTTLEWFSADASEALTDRTQQLVAGTARSYAALEGGGVLAVIAPPANVSSSFQNTWVIDPDGALEEATPIEGDLAQPTLFGGAGGAPLLWTGTGPSGAPGRWFRWQPWTGAFAPIDVLDDTPGRVVQAAASPDPGMALWLDTTSTPRLAALRFDVRGTYSALSGPLLLSDTTDTVPDCLPAQGVLSFDPTAGLTLGPGASAFVSDRTYADVHIEVDTPGQPALVVLRDALGDELEVGGAACPGAIVTGAASTLTVERKGASLTWAVSGEASGTCALGFDADARVSVGVRGAPDLISSVARNLRVTRLGAP